MAKFGGNGNNKPQPKTAPNYPPICGVCDAETTVAIMGVFNNNTGKSELGAFSGHTKKGSYGFSSGDQIFMNDQFQFKFWITRCGDCYQKDLERCGKRAIDYCRQTARERAEQAERNNTGR